MATTYKAILWKAIKSGHRAVHIRITVQRQHAYMASGVAVAESFWNPNADLVKANWVRSSHPDAKLFNTRIRDLLSDVQALALDGVPRTAAEIQQAVAVKNGLRRGALDAVAAGEWVPSEEAKQLDFLVYFSQEVTRRATLGHPRSVEKLSTILQKVRVYLAPPRDLAQPDQARAAELESQRLAFAQLSPKWVRDYADYLATLGNKDSTIKGELTFLKTIVRRAIEDGHLTDDQNPFKRLRLHEPAPTAKIKLTQAQITALEQLVLPLPTRGLKRYTNMSMAREVWLLQYFLLGTRIGDVLTLRWRDVHPDVVRFREHKTNKEKIAPRHARLNAVLDRLRMLAPHQPPHSEDFLSPLLNAAAPYARYPLDGEWKQLAKLLATRPTWLLLLKRVESATTSINAGLKKLAPLLGMQPSELTSHTARHSFANAGRLSGIPAAHMRDMLNHSSVAQTETYFGQLEKGEAATWALQVYEHPG